MEFRGFSESHMAKPREISGFGEAAELGRLADMWISIDFLGLHEIQIGFEQHPQLHECAKFTAFVVVLVRPMLFSAWSLMMWMQQNHGTHVCFGKVCVVLALVFLSREDN